MNTIVKLITFLILSTFVECAIFNRYQPTHGEVARPSMASGPQKFKIEKLASYKTTPLMQQTAVDLIHRYFHPTWPVTGQDSQQIGTVSDLTVDYLFFI
jgi:hypothetical protein